MVYLQSSAGFFIVYDCQDRSEIPQKLKAVQMAVPSRVADDSPDFGNRASGGGGVSGMGDRALANRPSGHAVGLYLLELHSAGAALLSREL